MLWFVPAPQSGMPREPIPSSPAPEELRRHGPEDLGVVVREFVGRIERLERELHRIRRQLEDLAGSRESVV